MNPAGAVVVFMVERQRFAVPLAEVVRVLPAVELTPVPGAPPVVVGVFDLHGELIPALDRRHRHAGSVRLSDQLIVVRTQRRILALLVDDVSGVVERPMSPLPASTEGFEPYRGTVRLADGVVLIHDVEMFLSPQEALAFDEALEALP